MNEEKDKSYLVDLFNNTQLIKQLGTPFNEKEDFEEQFYSIIGGYFKEKYNTDLLTNATPICWAIGKIIDGINGQYSIITESFTEDEVKQIVLAMLEHEQDNPNITFVLRALMLGHNELKLQKFSDKQNEHVIIDEVTSSFGCYNIISSKYPYNIKINHTSIDFGEEIYGKALQAICKIGYTPELYDLCTKIKNSNGSDNYFYKYIKDNNKLKEFKSAINPDNQFQTQCYEEGRNFVNLAVISLLDDPSDEAFVNIIQGVICDYIMTFEEKSNCLASMLEVSMQQANTTADKTTRRFYLTIIYNLIRILTGYGVEPFHFDNILYEKYFEVLQNYGWQHIIVILNELSEYKKNFFYEFITNKKQSNMFKNLQNKVKSFIGSVDNIKSALTQQKIDYKTALSYANQLITNIIKCKFLTKKERDEAIVKFVNNMLNINSGQLITEVLFGEELATHHDYPKEAYIKLSNVLLNVPTTKKYTYANNNKKLFYNFISNMPTEQGEQLLYEIKIFEIFFLLMQHAKVEDLPVRLLYGYDENTFTIDGLMTNLEETCSIVGKDDTVLHELYKKFDKGFKTEEERKQTILDIINHISTKYPTEEKSSYCKTISKTFYINKIGEDGEEYKYSLMPLIYSKGFNTNEIARTILLNIKDFNFTIRAILNATQAPICDDILTPTKKNMINKEGEITNIINKYSLGKVKDTEVFDIFKHEFIKNMFDEQGQLNQEKLQAQKDFVEYITKPFNDSYPNVTGYELITFVTKDNLGQLMFTELEKINKTIEQIGNDKTIKDKNFALLTKFESEKILDVEAELENKVIDKNGKDTPTQNL